MICITSKHNGFIRCGVRHPSKPTEHADDRFSDEELEILKAERMLTVEHVDDPEGSGDDDETEEEKIAAVLDSAKKGAMVEADKNGKEDAPEYFFTEGNFRTLPMPKAQEISRDLYKVTGRSWDGLWSDFSAAQTAAFAKGQE